MFEGYDIIITSILNSTVCSVKKKAKYFFFIYLFSKQRKMNLYQSKEMRDGQTKNLFFFFFFFRDVYQ